MSRLADIVARRHGLTEDETAELRGRTLAQLTSHARHLVDRRRVVESAKRRNPMTPDYVIEGHYDGGGVELDDDAGRELALEAFRDAVRSRDSRTTGFLGRLGENTLKGGDTPAKKRIAARLAAAGLTTEDEPA